MSRNSYTTHDVANWLFQYIWYIKCKTTIFYIALTKKQKNYHDRIIHNWPFVFSLALLVCCAIIFLYQICPKELFYEHLLFYILIVDRIFGGNQDSLILKAKKIKRLWLFFSTLVQSTKLITASCGCCLFQSKNLRDLCSRTILMLGRDQS